MRRSKLLFISFLFLHCLKAERSPFDSSSPSGIVNNVIVQRVTATQSTTNATTATTPTSTTTGNISIISTIPADGATAVSVSTTITVKFSNAVNPATVTVSTSGTTCTGNLQLSDDGFITCLPFTGNPTTTDNINFTATPLVAVSLKASTVYKIKVTTGVQDSSGNTLAANYVSSNGVTTDTPCSGANCLITASLGAGNLVADGGHSITLPTGSANAGKTLIVLGNNTNLTVLYNPSNATFSQGPVLTGNAGLGANSFIVPSGSNSGKIVIIHGNVSGNTTLYDPSTNTTSVGPTFTGCGVGPSDSANNFLITSGANSGKVEVTCADPIGRNSVYDPAANTFSAAISLSAAGGPGSNTFPITTGTNAGFTAIIRGNNGTSVEGFNPVTTGFTFSTNLTIAASSGSGNFTVATGAQAGKTLVYVAGALSTTNFFDPTTNSFSATSPNLTGVAGYGANNFLFTSGTNKDKTLVIHGNTTSATSIYDPATNTFAVGPTLPNPVYKGGSSFDSGSGIYPTARVIVHGNTTSNASIYFP